MNRTHAYLLLALLLVLVPACGDHGHPHDESGGHPADDQGSVGERPTVAVTHWTDRTELFMEYPVFVAGESGRSAIHVTDLADFSPLSTGEAVVSLRGSDGSILEFRGGVSRPGIYGVDLLVEQAGVYTMSLLVDAPGLQDVHELGNVTVHAPASKLPPEPDEGEAISFLKEQQWTLEFGTTAVAARGIRAGVTVPATVQPRSGGDALLTATVPGRLDPAIGIPIPGTRVRAGEILARIVPRSDDLRDAAGLRAALVEAKQAHVLALQDRDRAARLVEARAVPTRRLDEAEAALTSSKALLDAAQERWDRFESLSQAAGVDSGAVMFTIRAPFDGVVSEVRIAAGASVDENDLLMRVVDPDRVHIIGTATESLASSLGTVTAGELILDGQPPVSLGEPFASNPVVEPVARTIAIRFALDNRGQRLRIGQAVRLRLFVSREESRTAIPESAVVDDGGRPVVFVQAGGESFQRRPVQLGSRADGYVHVIEGVEPGERVVHRGAYLVRLAAMSTQIPAHGHVH